MPRTSCRVLFIASAYPRHAGDVITPWLGTTIEKLGEAGVEVEVLAPAYHGSPTHVVANVRVHRFRYAPARWEMLSHDHPIPWQMRQRPIRLGLVPGYLAASAIAATRLASTGRFQVIHAFWPVPHALPGIAARKLTGTPLVSTFFGAELDFFATRHAAGRLAVRSIVRHSNAVTAISSYTARKLEAVAPGANPIIIPFGAALAPAISPQRHPFADGPPRFLFVGRLVARKGVDVLLRALAQLAATGARLTIVGDGAERGSLERLAASLDLGAQVTFTGYVPDVALERHMADCDALVLPAVGDDTAGTEGLGVVLIEALSRGVPVIASDVGGIPDIVQHERTGVLVPAGDVDALARAMQQFIAQPTRARVLGAAGRAHVEVTFGWPRIVASLVALYTSLRSMPA